MPAARWIVGLACAAAVALGFVATRGARRPSARALPRSPVHEVTLARPDFYWVREGFVPMEPPVRPPTSEDGRDRIVVYLKLPDPGLVKTQARDGGEGYALEYPAGTTADRVEYLARTSSDDGPQPDWLVADVRGTRLGAEGQEFHVYRRTGSSPAAALLGMAWPRGDGSAQSEATSQVGRLVEEGRVIGPHGADDLTGASLLRAMNDCAACHTPERPPRATMADPAAMSRGTDASGFFQVSTVLSDRAPVETHRPRNANAGDAFLRYECGPRAAPALVDKGWLGDVKCPGGEVPEGILDVRAAVRASDPHALRVCVSRTFLYEHLDANGKRVFRDAMDECARGD